MAETEVGQRTDRSAQRHQGGRYGNRRAWADFHHIINPHTLASPRHILAIWAIAETTLIADAMATCLFFTPADTLLAHYRFSYLIVKADHTLEMSPDFPAEIFVA